MMGAPWRRRPPPRWGKKCFSDYARGKGNFDGIDFRPHGGRYDPGAYLSGFIHSKGPTSATDGNTMPELDGFIEFSNRQLDYKERLATFYKIQQLAARTQPKVPMGAHQQNIELIWEWVRGLGDLVGWAGVQYGRHTQTIAHHYGLTSRSSRNRMIFAPLQSAPSAPGHPGWPVFRRWRRLSAKATCTDTFFTG